MPNRSCSARRFRSCWSGLPMRTAMLSGPVPRPGRRHMSQLKLEPASPAFQPGEGGATMASESEPSAKPAASPPVRRRALWAVARPYAMAVLVAAVLVAGALWLGPRLLFGPRVVVNMVTRSDFVQSVVASGHVEAPHRVSVGAQITGVVKRVPVAEGQSVEAGQVLVELESSESVAAMAQADAAVQQAQARLRQLREVQAPVAEQAVRQAQINVDNARAQLRRNTELFKQGFIGQAALDDLKKAVDLNAAQLRSARSQLESALPNGSDHAVAVTALAEAHAVA